MKVDKNETAALQDLLLNPPRGYKMLVDKYKTIWEAQLCYLLECPDCDLVAARARLKLLRKILELPEYIADYDHTGREDEEDRVVEFTKRDLLNA